MTSSKQLVYFSVLGGLALFTAIVLVGIYGDGRQATKLTGKPLPPPTVTMAVTPNPVPAYYYVYQISGTGFTPGAGINFVKEGVAFFTTADQNGYATSTWQSYTPGTFTAYAKEFQGREYVQVGSITFQVVDMDADNDGFISSQEVYLGTDPNKACPSTTASNDEPVDAWPADFNDDGYFNIGDINSFLAPNRSSDDGHGTFNKFNHPVPDIGIDGQDHDPLIKRWDLVKDSSNIINIADMGAVNPGINSPMIYPSMFNGESAFGKKCPTTP